MHALTKSLHFFQDVRLEGKRIIWPGLAETRTMTLVVMALVVAVGIYLLLVDAIISASMNWMLGV